MLEEYTKLLVREAISRYESDGRDATLAHCYSAESIDGQWYAFLAHAANSDLVDGPFSVAMGPNDYPVGEAVAAVADEDGKWSSYTYLNSATGTADTKQTWIVEYDVLIFGSGRLEQ